MGRVGEVGLANIAAAQAGAGDTRGATATFASARQTAQGIDDEWGRSGALAHIAAAQAKARDTRGATATFASARQTAQSIGPWRGGALASIAAAQAEAGDITGALQTALGIDYYGDDSFRAQVLVRVVDGLHPFRNMGAGCRYLPVNYTYYDEYYVYDFHHDLLVSEY